MVNSLTILIPCYNQPNKLKYSLQSLVNQSFKHFKVYLIDDCSTISYNNIISKYPSLNIRVFKNQSNLGAFNNILQCISFRVKTKYKMVFHEDDVLHPRWLEIAMLFLSKEGEKISWIGCNMDFFKSYSGITFKTLSALPIYEKNDVTSLVNHILLGKSLSFCSIIYNSTIVETHFLNLSDYSVLGDRVLLLDLAIKHEFIYVDFSFVHAFDHGEDYSRWIQLRYHNIINYYSYLKKFIPQNNLINEEYKANLTNSLLSNTLLVRNVSIWEKISFYLNAYYSELIYIKYHILYIWRKRKLFLFNI